MKKIFLSYSHKDKSFVNKLKERLLEREFQVIDFRDEVNAGDVILKALFNIVKVADVFIFVISEDYNKSNWQSSEIGLVLHEVTNNPNKLIIPVIIDKNASIPPAINQYAYIDYVDNRNFEENTKKIIDAINLGKDEPMNLNKNERKILENEKRKENIELEKTLREALNARKMLLEQEKLNYEIKRTTSKNLSTFYKFAYIAIIVSGLAAIILSLGLLVEKISINKDLIVGITIGLSIALIPSLYLITKLAKGGKNGR